jgi:hypothetical protein
MLEKFSGGGFALIRDGDAIERKMAVTLPGQSDYYGQKCSSTGIFKMG